jgi:outer membrane immunogenic protein
MKKLLVGVTAATALCAAPALAADMPVKAPVYPAVAPVFSWTGFYLGIAGGGGWGSTRHTNAVNLATSGTVGIHGGLFGGTFGYNWQTGPLVLGLEGDISWSGIRSTFTDTGSGFCTSAFPCVTDLRWLGTGRGRIGYAFAQHLLYATGGVAYGSVRATVLGTCCTDETRTRTGYAVGGGFETAFYQNWSVKLEYLYVNFGTRTNYTNVGGTVAENVFLDAHILRAGLNYRFGGPVIARF